MANLNRNQRLFRWIFLIFVALMVAMGIHMGSQTTAPWNKKKQIIRAWDGEKKK
jgi:hypothetical protein